MVLLAVLFCAFATGVAWIFSLLFATGDIYPPYSSLRADPLGTRVLYESLDALPGRTTHRNYLRPPEVRGNPPEAWLFLGAHEWNWTTMHREQAAFLLETMRSGCTVLLALTPRQVSSRPSEPAEEKPAASEPQDEPEPDLDTVSRTDAQFVRFRDLFELDIVPAPSPGAGPVGDLASDPRRLEPHSGEWRILRVDADGILMTERTFGSGRLVVLADSFALSNEGLAMARDSGLIARILGPARTIWFDEWHLGLVEQPGVGTLIARYGLYPFLAALVFSGLLYAWRISVPLIPPTTDGLEQLPSRRAAREGFVSLLRRGVSPQELPAACWNVWKEFLQQNPRLAQRSAAAVQEAESVLAREEKAPPVTRFREINRLFQNYKDLK